MATAPRTRELATPTPLAGWTPEGPGWTVRGPGTRSLTARASRVARPGQRIGRQISRRSRSRWPPSRRTGPQSAARRDREDAHIAAVGDRGRGGELCRGDLRADRAG
jgi:hypothetical protein